MATLEEYMAKDYPMLIEPGEESGFIVTFPDLPGVIAHNDIREEAIKSAERLKELWIGGRLDLGWPVPEPGTIPLVRLSDQVQVEVARLAQKEHVNADDLISELVQAALADRANKERLGTSEDPS